MRLREVLLGGLKVSYICLFKGTTCKILTVYFFLVLRLVCFFRKAICDESGPQGGKALVHSNLSLEILSFRTGAFREYGGQSNYNLDMWIN